MATFQINKGYTGEEVVKADYYKLSNGYFDFYQKDNRGDLHVVFTMNASDVHTIARQQDP